MSYSQKLIAGLAVKYQGDWDKIYAGIQNKEYLEDKELDEFLSTVKSKYVTITDPRYPSFFKNFYKPPFVLFYYGDLNLLFRTDIKKRLAVIGTRKPTEYGIKMTKEAVSDLCKDFIIVSGMASGVDSLAHWAAINNGGKTIAILGSGIDYVYPSENILLYNKLKESHLVISEYPNKVVPTPDKFPFRNRLVAYYSNAVVITEAYEKSGTSITANIAISNSKDVLCFPDLATKNSCCNRLIKQGAIMVESASDIRYELENYSEKFTQNF